MQNIFKIQNTTFLRIEAFVVSMDVARRQKHLTGRHLGLIKPSMFSYKDLSPAGITPPCV